MPRAWYTSDRIHVISRRLAVFFGVLLLVWVGSRIPVLSPVYAGAQGVLYRAGSALGRATARLFANETSLTAQLASCTEQLSVQTRAAADGYAARDERDEWRTLVGYRERTTIQGTVARIIARESPESSRVIIDRGRHDGIEPNTAVVIGDGLLYGVVQDVSELSSVVALTEDDASTIAASLLGRTKTIGLVTGQDGALLTMEYIPQETRIAIGDVVVTSGLDGEIPEGLVLGIVSEVIATANAPFMHAMISPVHDPRDWTSVLVLPPASRPPL